MRSARLAPLSGVLFVVLLIIGFIPLSGDTPDVDESAQKITDFYADKQGQEIAAIVVVMLAALFLAVFAVSLRDYLRGGNVRGGNGGADFWPTLALVGGAVAVAGFLVAAGIHFALVDGADQEISPDAMVALNALDNDDFPAFSLPLGIMLLGAAGATLRDGANLPRWMAWVAIVLLILMFTPVGFAGFGLAGIWIIVASILMYQRAGAGAAAPPAA
jgi:hypothetical protein